MHLNSSLREIIFYLVINSKNNLCSSCSSLGISNVHSELSKVFFLVLIARITFVSLFLHSLTLRPHKKLTISQQIEVFKVVHSYAKNTICFSCKNGPHKKLQFLLTPHHSILLFFSLIFFSSNFSSLFFLFHLCNAYRAL